MKKRLGRNDLILIGGLVMLAVIILAVGNIFLKEDGTKVTVTVEGEIYGTYSLEKEQTIRIKKEEQVTNILQIKNKQAVMLHADCPDQLCVHQSAITKKGQNIVCLPNQVVAEVTGDQTDEKDLDAVVK